MSPTQEEYDALDELHRKDHVRIRALEAAKDEAVARLAEALERWPSVMARAEKAEAALATAQFELHKWEHGCSDDWCDAHVRLERAAGRATADPYRRRFSAENQECGT